ncbi:hypothetical protein SK128_019457 [Halocaridina rubra]|uniref:RING-type domain-containing protein n=1 Tax=Halocaridina rubra TaxID=373956 RepID=A0AAN8ZT46_HALRR
MPGAASAVRDSRQRRERGGHRAAKRSSSSAAVLQKTKSEVVATGYTPFDADLPPVTIPISVPQVSSAQNGRHAKTCMASSDHQERFLRKQSSFEGIRETSTGSSTSSGVSSASSSPLSEKSRSLIKLSVAETRGLTTDVKLPSSSAMSSPPSSPEGHMPIDEDDVMCAICLDLLHRPRSLPCGHTFCLLCLQNYANSCRTIITCPSCRGAAHVPTEGVMGLPPNNVLAEMVQIIRERRMDKSLLTCVLCKGTEEVAECSHCKQHFCKSCGDLHAKKVQMEVAELKQRLLMARDTLSCRAEEDETRFRKLEESIDEVVENRVAMLHEECRKLQAQVQEMRKANEQQSHSLSRDIDKVLGAISSQTNNQLKWEKVSQLHASLKRLLKATTNAKGPRITLDEVNLKLSTSAVTSAEEPDTKDDEEDDRQLACQDHSLFYRRKGTLARMRWGQHLGERPAGVAVNPVTSDIFVTGSDTCRVYMFDSSGKQLGHFGSRGHNDGQFLCPIGVAFSLVSKEVFITDKWKHCIHVFDTEGHFIRQLGRKGKGYGHFSSPEGIATDQMGRIYVADTCNHRVQVLDGDGVFLREVGVISCETLRDGHRYTKSEFNEPTGVAASLDGSKIYVADAGNHRIKVFSGSTGTRELMFGSRGKHKSQFESPESIAVDPEGFILVGDSGNGRVQVFRPNGNFVRFLGSRGHSHGEIGWVSGIALSKSLDVVVTDFKNNLVAVF